MYLPYGQHLTGNNKVVSALIRTHSKIGGSRTGTWWALHLVTRIGDHRMPDVELRLRRGASLSVSSITYYNWACTRSSQNHTLLDSLGNLLFCLRLSD